jgi:hypothetical protein
MFINLNSVEMPMKMVYRLCEEHKADPDFVESTQELSLNENRPHSGLSPRYGLYGSPEWWENIRNGTIPHRVKSGVITRLYVAGMSESVVNSIDVRLQDGSVHTGSIYVNDDSDSRMFRIGCRVDVVYVLCELKKQPAQDGGINYAPDVLEMAVSLNPVDEV